MISMHYLDFWPHLKTFMLRERLHLTVSEFEKLEQNLGISSLKDLAKLDGKMI